MLSVHCDHDINYLLEYVPFINRNNQYKRKTTFFRLARHSHFHGVAVLDFSRAELQENSNDPIWVYAIIWGSHILIGNCLLNSHLQKQYSKIFISNLGDAVVRVWSNSVIIIWRQWPKSEFNDLKWSWRDAPWPCKNIDSYIVLLLENRKKRHNFALD